MYVHLNCEGNVDVLGYREIRYGLHAIGAKFPYRATVGVVLRDGAPTLGLCERCHVPQGRK